MSINICGFGLAFTVCHGVVTTVASWCSMVQRDAPWCTTMRRVLPPRDKRVKASPHRHKWMLSHGAPADPSDPWNSHAAPVSPRQNAHFTARSLSEFKQLERIVWRKEIAGLHTGSRPGGFLTC